MYNICQGNNKAALENYKKSMELNPNNIKTKNIVGELSI